MSTFSRCTTAFVLLALANATYTIPLRVPRRLSNDGVSVFGGVLSDGYIACTIYVGRDEQPFDVVLDTGSPLTIVPCNTCHDCGEHSHYHPGSDTVWGDRFRIHYVEGSKLEGRFLTAPVRLHNTVLPSAQIGCASVMTNQFRSQNADGILGLDADGILETYMSRNGALAKTFALHLSRSSDRLLLGLEPPSTYNVACPMLKHGGNFYIRFDSMSVGEHLLETEFPRLLIDSGTTYIYLKPDLLNPLRKLLQRDYGFESAHNSEIGCVASLDEVPETLVITGPNECQIELRPIHWIVHRSAGFCAAIYDTGWGNDNTFGLVALEERETTFIFGDNPSIRMRNV